MVNHFDRIFKEESEMLIKAIATLEIISSLRNLQPLLTKIMETMPITYDIRKDVRFKQDLKRN